MASTQGNGNGSADEPRYDIFLNGRMLPAGEARVGVEDAGLQHAVGLFETMAVVGGRAFRLEAHLRRLASSADTLGLAKHMEIAPLAEAVEATLLHNRLRRARLRLTVTAGEVSMLKASADVAPGPTLLIVCSPPTAYDPQYFEQGITAMIAEPRANPLDPLASHKTLSYWTRLRSLRQAASAGCGEAIWLSVTNHLVGGAISNLLLVKDGVLKTPIVRGEEAEGGLPSPVLPGVTRSVLLDLAVSEGLTVERGALTIDDLLDADEAMLTNSGWGVLPVVRVEKSEIGGGAVGAVATRLRALLVEEIERECGG